MQTSLLQWRVGFALALLGVGVACVPVAGPTALPENTLASPPESQSTPDTPLPPYPAGPAYPTDTVDVTALTLVALKETMAVELLLSPGPTLLPPATMSPAEMATLIQGYKDAADITLANQGQTFTYTITSRFFVFLDDATHPVAALTCEPD